MLNISGFGSKSLEEVKKALAERDLHLRIEWMEYESAKALVQSQGIKTRRAFIEWIQSEGPENIPFLPEQEYKPQWESWREFLGLEMKKVDGSWKML